MFEMEMKIYSRCPFCGKEAYISVDFKNYDAWKHGELIQNAFPYLSANEREMLKTGICSECWENMFPPEEDDEPEEFDYDFADTYCEIGFNPYMGCYDWDC